MAKVGLEKWQRGPGKMAKIGYENIENMKCTVAVSQINLTTWPW